MTNKQVSSDQFAQTAAELRKSVACAVKEGVEKLRAKRLADNQTAMRLIATIPGQVKDAIESLEPEPGVAFALPILCGKWDELYSQGNALRRLHVSRDGILPRGRSQTDQVGDGGRLRNFDLRYSTSNSATDETGFWHAPPTGPQPQWKRCF